MSHWAASARTSQLPRTGRTKPRDVARHRVKPHRKIATNALARRRRPLARDRRLDAWVDAIETQTISGNGTGENFEGILNTTGINSVAFDTDPSTTLRHALTVLQSLGEQPNGWVLNPEDAEALDLERWGTSGGFLHGGYESEGPGTSDNILGAGVQRIISPNVPVGVAIVADWSQLALYYRESMRIDVDGSGTLFEINAVRFHAESRCVSAVLRPQAFAVCDLTATSTRSKSTAKSG